MVERPDIDALLIGALYGELTPADEARLAAHFESHPGDRTALAAMTDTRQAVRESRILQVHFEPPQSVSALLLQEAARRAPKKVEPKDAREQREGWFARFVRSFVAHPAMAAAAMLVIVVGVAGTMYLREGDQFADKTYESAPAAGSAVSTTAQPGPSLQQADELKREAGSAYGVGLATELEAAKEAETDRARGEKQAAARSDGSSYLELKPPVREPKDLDERARPAKKAPKPTIAKGNPAAGSEDGFVEGRAATGAAKPADPSPAAADSAPQAPPPPPPPGAGAPATRSKDKTVKLDDSKAEQKPEAKADGSQVVRDLHVRLVNQVKAGNCREAAGLAIEIASRDRAYYAQNVESDRAVKPCIAYITAERERETEKTQKRATQKRADEPAKPSK